MVGGTRYLIGLLGAELDVRSVDIAVTYPALWTLSIACTARVSAAVTILLGLRLSFS